MNTIILTDMAGVAEMITRVRGFNVDGVNYRPPKVNSRGGKNIAVTMDNHRMVLQIPLTRCWGIIENLDGESGRKSYSVNLQIDQNPEDNTGNRALFEAIRSFQNKVLTDAVNNSKQWFGNSKMSRDVVEALFYPILKYPKNKETDELDETRNPSMKLKIPYWDGTFNLELYDMDKNLLFNPQMSEERTPVDLVQSGSHITGLIECGGIWFAGGRWGVTWKLLQAKVRPQARIKGFCMLDDSDEEDTLETLDKADEQQAANQEENTETQPLIEDDEEEASQEVVTEAPPKKAKKKRVVKKA